MHATSPPVCASCACVVHARQASATEGQARLAATTEQLAQQLEPAAAAAGESLVQATQHLAQQAGAGGNALAGSVHNAGAALGESLANCLLFVITVVVVVAQGKGVKEQQGCQVRVDFASLYRGHVRGRQIKVCSCHT